MGTYSRTRRNIDSRCIVILFGHLGRTELAFVPSTLPPVYTPFRCENVWRTKLAGGLGDTNMGTWPSVHAVTVLGRRHHLKNGDPRRVRRRERTLITPQQAWLPGSAAGINKRPHDARPSGTAQTPQTGHQETRMKYPHCPPIDLHSGRFCFVLRDKRTSPNSRKRMRRCHCFCHNHNRASS